MSQTHYNPEDPKIQKATQKILKIIRPGDVVNQANTFPRWQLWMIWPVRAIRRHQKRLFGKDARYQDDHTMLFFDRTRTLSVEPPRAVLKPLESYCLTELSIYRLRHHRLTEDDLSIMFQAARQLEGIEYDVGQLLDIALNNLLSFEHRRTIKIFDFGEEKKVCSVGVRSVLENLYQKKLQRGSDDPPTWLFNRMNPAKWPAEQVRRFRGTDIEATTPAHFANADYFAHEFRLVARFRSGEMIYPVTPVHFLRRLLKNAKTAFQKILRY